MDDRVGQQLGNYRLMRVLGEGAFATVYLGEHLYLERVAAIKVLRVRMEPKIHESFRHEARTIAQLHHPHIIAVHDFGIEDEMPYLIMDYTPNGTLRSRHPKGTQLSYEQIMVYVKQIASALDYAHEQRIVHRDIKPENILLNTKHEVVLSDFGLAVVQPLLDSISTQTPAGTPLYMAPEQIRGKPRAESDQYALGVMIYEWLCGQPPFRGSIYEVFDHHLNNDPPSLRERVPQLSLMVEEAVLGAMAKNPRRRFPTVQDFATVLGEALFTTQPLAVDESTYHLPISRTTQYDPSPSMPASMTDSPLDWPQSAQTFSTTQRPISGATQYDPSLSTPTSTHYDPYLPTPAPTHYNPSLPTPLPLTELLPPWPGPAKAVRKSGVSRRAVLIATVGAAVTGTGTLMLLRQLAIPQNQLFIYQGHAGAVQAVAWSPDGKRIASGSLDGTVQVWNASDGSSVLRYQGHRQLVNAVAWSPDGKRIASGSIDGTVQVWNANNGGNVFSYRGHADSVRAVAWSLNGKRIASSSNDDTVRVWNANNGSNVVVCQGHSNYVNTVAWSRDGERIASGSSDTKVAIWNASKGNNLLIYKGHSDLVWSVAWSRDGKRIASASNDKRVQVWNASDGSTISTYLGHTDGVKAVAWSSDGQHIASGSDDGTVRVWHVQ